MRKEEKTVDHSVLPSDMSRIEKLRNVIFNSYDDIDTPTLHIRRKSGANY
jgi:hypothetical protein